MHTNFRRATFVTLFSPHLNFRIGFKTLAISTLELTTRVSHLGWPLGLATRITKLLGFCILVVLYKVVSISKMEL